MRRRLPLAPWAAEVNRKVKALGLIHKPARKAKPTTEAAHG